MRERKTGRIINFSSNSALGSPGQPNYGAAKAGILGLTYSGATSLKKYGITVNAIMPGAATRMTDSIPRAGMPGVSGLAVSESAEGTTARPGQRRADSRVSRERSQAAEVTVAMLGASGYRITRYTHMKTGPGDL